jgi:hypothetical protein
MHAISKEHIGEVIYHERLAARTSVRCSIDAYECVIVLDDIANEEQHATMQQWTVLAHAAPGPRPLGACRGLVLLKSNGQIAMGFDNVG